MCAKVMRSGPDGALADVGAFIQLAQSNQALLGTLPPEMVHAISKGDTEGLQRMFRCGFLRCLLTTHHKLHSAWSSICP